MEKGGKFYAITAGAGWRLGDLQKDNSKGELKMLKTVLRIFLVAIIGLVAGILGLIIGALIGGNYAEQFIFNGVRGYEATSQVGFALGALTGLVSGWWFLFKRTKRAAKNKGK